MLVMNKNVLLIKIIFLVCFFPMGIIAEKMYRQINRKANGPTLYFIVRQNSHGHYPYIRILFCYEVKKVITLGGCSTRFE